MMRAAASNAVEDPGTNARRRTLGGGLSSAIRRKSGNFFDFLTVAPDPPTFNVARAITQRRLGIRTDILQSTRFNEHPLHRTRPQRGIVQNWGDPVACDFWGSVGTVKKLKIFSMLPHGAHVSALNFSSDGNYLVSGSEDSKVNIWSWAAIEAFPPDVRLPPPSARFQSPPHQRSFFPGHVRDVTQTKFVMYPRHGPTRIATASRDTQVRLLEVDSTGDFRSNRSLAMHEDGAVKIAVTLEDTSRLLSCSPHSTIFSTDLRTFDTWSLGVAGDFLSIAASPVNSHDFVVTVEGLTTDPPGQRPSILVFDLRSVRSGPKLRFEEPWMYRSLMSYQPWTQAVYNWNGTEVLASKRNVDALFSFSAETGRLLMKFYGLHNDYVTNKDVNYFGCRSEFVVAGSDDRKVWIWEAKSGAIAHVLNSINVVKVVEPHPTLPALATSGTEHHCYTDAVFPPDDDGRQHDDYDAKIWLPLENEDPQVLEDAHELAERNIYRRMISGTTFF